MIAQLQLLEQTILELKARYNITATELANLKHKLAHDDTPRQISDLKAQLSQAKTDNDALTSQIDELNKAKSSLEKQVAELYTKTQELSKHNQELTDKNALAISRAEIIQEWLTKIDNQNI